jgi:hypothetical protein
VISCGDNARYIYGENIGGLPILFIFICFKRIFPNRGGAQDDQDGGLLLDFSRQNVRKIWDRLRRDGGPDRRGTGFYFGNVTEMVLFDVRGRLRTLDPGRSQENIILSRADGLPMPGERKILKRKPKSHEPA